MREYRVCFIKGVIDTRSLKQQFNYLITSNCKFGADKRAIKHGSHKPGTIVFSVKHAESLRATVSNLCNFLKETHPEIKQVNQITSQHIEEWYNARVEKWSKSTLEMHGSNIRKLELLAKKMFKTCTNDFSKAKYPDKVNRNPNRVRDIQMTEEDFRKLEKILDNGTSKAKIAVQITYRAGLRINEVCHLKAERINLKKRVIEVREGAKGGRDRDVPIQPRDFEYFRELKHKVGKGYVCPVKPCSANLAIRKAMIKVGIANKYLCTTTHSIRKLYAQNRYDELRHNGYSQGMETFDIVAKELGHNGNRTDLFKTYIANRW